MVEDVFDYVLDVMRLERLLKRLTSSWSAQTGLSLNELRILLYVSVYPNQPIGKVAQSLDISKGSLAQSIGALTHDGWIQSEPSLPDRRLRNLALTDAGVQRVATIKEGLTTTLDTPPPQSFTEHLSHLNKKL